MKILKFINQIQILLTKLEITILPQTKSSGMTLMVIKKFIAAFLFKNKLSCLILNFSDYHQEFFQVRSIWYFERFSSMSLGIFSKISQLDWK